MSPSSTTCPTKSFWSRQAAPDEPGPARKSNADWNRDILSSSQLLASRSPEMEEHRVRPPTALSYKMVLSYYNSERSADNIIWVKKNIPFLLFWQGRRHHPHRLPWRMMTSRHDSVMWRKNQTERKTSLLRNKRTNLQYRNAACK